MATTSLTDGDFRKTIAESPHPVVVDFWAEWCGPCRQIGPALEELSDEMADRVTIAKMDIDSNPNTPAELGIRGIPALFVFKNGELVANMSGAKSKDALREWIESSI